mmetsp:Transcript_1871/g.2692  ORF Transcript_1871/g.2692 Transcript_1871/m.2692 type:complete len:634 (+) Transcript_1871:273-2174(+)|eukprot:CAMPEP_0184863362 /NCGR_PEP_ID=MMETSP0580-20130426/10695_1 /TAXON_ID=1118495 /ORGANISM="Dactyliosolen fragilissimus" /LENGTH=633 /DNA_ID=CAMNT_0027361651 /DNA_START=218 /DNA_END=2119 /DNA_ORIENTATION=-
MDSTSLNDNENINAESNEMRNDTGEEANLIPRRSARLNPHAGLTEEEDQDSSDLVRNQPISGSHHAMYTDTSKPSSATSILRLHSRKNISPSLITSCAPTILPFHLDAITPLDSVVESRPARLTLSSVSTALSLTTNVNDIEVKHEKGLGSNSLPSQRDISAGKWKDSVKRSHSSDQSKEELLRRPKRAKSSRQENNRRYSAPRPGNFDIPSETTSGNIETKGVENIALKSEDTKNLSKKCDFLLEPALNTKVNSISYAKVKVDSTPSKNTSCSRLLDTSSAIMLRNSCFLASVDPQMFGHLFIATYGSSYYQSLKSREELEYSCLQFEKGVISSNSPVNRMRTRSFSKENGRKKGKSDVLDLKKGSSSDTYEFNTQYPRYLLKQVYLSLEMRSILVDWMIDVSRDLKFNPNTYHLAVALLDRAMDHIIVKKSNLQCLGCACLLIAGKLEEVKPPSAADISFFTDSACTLKEINSMELQVCLKLQFRLQSITSFHFLDRFSKGAHIAVLPNITPSYLHTNPRFESMVLYLTDVSLLLHEFVDTKKSLVAASAVYIAKVVVGLCKKNEKVWDNEMKDLTGYSSSDLEHTVLILYEAQAKLEKMKAKGILKKYRSTQYRNLALQLSVHLDGLGFK